MVLSAFQIAKRAFVKILLTFAAQYQVSLAVTRDSADKEVLAAYRRLVKRVHPDKGGKKEDQQKLQAAKDDFDAAVANACKRGRPTKPDGKRVDPKCERLQDVAEKSTYTVQAQGVLLTYHGLRDHGHWREFVCFLQANVQKWKVLGNPCVYIYHYA